MVRPVTLIGLAVLPGLKQRLLPSFRERNLLVHLEGAPGASQPESSRIAGRMSAELQAIFMAYCAFGTTARRNPSRAASAASMPLLMAAWLPLMRLTFR